LAAHWCTCGTSPKLYKMCTNGTNGPCTRPGYDTTAIVPLGFCRCVSVMDQRASACAWEHIYIYTGLCNKFSSCFDIRIRIRSFGAVTLGELVTRECVVGFVGKSRHKFEICARRTSRTRQSRSMDFDGGR